MNWTGAASLGRRYFDCDIMLRIRAALSRELWSDVYNDNTYDNKFDNFYKAFMYYVSLNIEIKKSRVGIWKPKEWVTGEMRI